MRSGNFCANARHLLVEDNLHGRELHLGRQVASPHREGVGHLPLHKLLHLPGVGHGVWVCARARRDACMRLSFDWPCSGLCLITIA